jgi:NAD(P)-dependent dehydrogenase (short-subunit alcohol dehydrogenase family)
MSDNWTEQHIPDQQGRVAIVTGANTGLGFETARMLAARRAAVVLAVRDVEKGKQAAAHITGDVTVQALDLTSLDSIRSAAADLRATHPRIDLLINNAGAALMYYPGPVPGDSRVTATPGMPESWRSLVTRWGPDRTLGRNHPGGQGQRAVRRGSR